MVRDFTEVNLDNADPQTGSDLMSKLSAEIRNQIWDLVFESPTVTARSDDPSNPDTPPPGILLSCKQAYHEAIKLHWSDSTFFIYGARPHRWLTRIGRRRRELLKDVRLVGHRPFEPASKGWSGRVLRLERQLRYGERLLDWCQAGEEGVHSGVIKIKLKVKESEDDSAPVTTIWTSEPREAAQEWLRRAGGSVFTPGRTITSAATRDQDDAASM